MFKNLYKQFNLFFVIVLWYFISIFLMGIFPQRSWGALLLGLCLGSFGAVGIFLLLRQWNSTLQCKYKKMLTGPSVSTYESGPFHSNESFQELQNTLSQHQLQHKEQLEELNQKTTAFHQLKKEQEQATHQMEDLQHELTAYRTNSEEDIRRKTVLLSEYQETINQQRDVIKRKKEQILELESKVHDLNYEVKTLLQLAEIEETKTSVEEINEMGSAQTGSSEVGNQFIPSTADYQIITPEEATIQLKRCIDIAQKITGSNRFGNGGSRFRDMQIDNFALDLRRLFDSLGSENSSTVIVFSQKEKRLLFVNNQIRNLLGWSTEKFIRNFTEIVQEGNKEWKKGLCQLTSTTHSNVRLLLKTKTGHNLLVHCHLAAIPTGVFRNHVIGVLFPA